MEAGLFTGIPTLSGQRDTRVCRPDNKKRRPGRLSYNGDNEIRTRGLYVANVALSQLSYVPLFISFSAAYTAEKMETTGLEPATPCV